jgi:hypothetical protein
MLLSSRYYSRGRTRDLRGGTHTWLLSPDSYRSSRTDTLLQSARAYLPSRTNALL